MASRPTRSLRTTRGRPHRAGTRFRNTDGGEHVPVAMGMSGQAADDRLAAAP